MFRSFSRSWELVKTSFSIIRQDKELLIFPIISVIALVIVSVAFSVPMALAGLFDGLGGDSGQGINPLVYMVGFLYYVVIYYIMIFANAAIVGAATVRLRGGDPTFGEAWSIAASRSGKILGWAIVSATVGMILRAAEQAIHERSGVVGQIAGAIIVGIAGAAWNIATFLVVPVLVIENLGPIDAIKRSASLLKRTWGEQIVGNFSMGIIFFVLLLAGALPLGLLIFILAPIAPLLAVLVGIILALYVFFIIALSTAVGAIFTAAVYAYATQTPIQHNIFEPGLIENAFAAKQTARMI
jgi:hypothetical protein